MGFAFGVCDGDSPDTGRILYHGVGVLPAWRGRGIGRRLLAEAQVAPQTTWPGARVRRPRPPSIARTSASQTLMPAACSKPTDTRSSATATRWSARASRTRRHMTCRRARGTPRHPRKRDADRPRHGGGLCRPLGVPGVLGRRAVRHGRPPAVGAARRVAGRLGRRRGRGRRPGFHQRGGEPPAGPRPRLHRVHLHAPPVAGARARDGAHRAEPAAARGARDDRGGPVRGQPEPDRRARPVRGCRLRAGARTDLFYQRAI